MVEGRLDEADSGGGGGGGGGTEVGVADSFLASLGSEAIFILLLECFMTILREGIQSALRKE